MIRIGGTFLPMNKKIKFALLKISGIGLSSASKILLTLGLNPNKKCIELSPKSIIRIRQLIEKQYLVGSFLKRKIFFNIKHLINIRSLRGKRHTLKLPVRGQRTRTNARTKRGKKITVSIKKK